MTTRRFLYLFASASMLFSCATGGYEITGYFPAAEDGTVVYMTSADENFTNIDSAVIKNGQFGFAGSSEGRKLCMLLVEKKAVGGPVVIEEGDITVRFGQGMLRGGTHGNEVLQRFVAGKEHLRNLQGVTSPEFLKNMPIGESMLDSLVAARDEAEKNLGTYALFAIEQNINNQLGLYLLSQSYASMEVENLNAFLVRVPDYLRDARYNLMREYCDHKIASVKRRKATAVGSGYVNFELPDLSDKKVLFSKIVEKNRYTLLQFWASWCAPCLAELPALAGVYDEYKKSGFAVVGVSLDSDKESCVAVCAAMKLRWVQLCAPSGGSGELASAYGVDAIPANVLVNDSGTIIARNISPEELARLLKESVAK